VDCDALFVCRDTGETLAFLPSMRKLNIKGWDTLALTITKNAAKLLNNTGARHSTQMFYRIQNPNFPNPKGVRTVTLEELGVNFGRDLLRNESLSTLQLETLRRNMIVARRLVIGSAFLNLES